MYIFKSKKHKKLEIKYEVLKIKTEKQENELSVIKNKIKFIDKLLKSYKILDKVENNLNQKYYVCMVSTEDMVDIYLRKNLSVNGNPRICTKLYYDYNKKEKYCEITDVIAVQENVGNGSILINYLINYLKEIGVSKIYGKLVYRDGENFDNLKHFYKKNGFQVTFNTDKTSGSIKKYLE